MAQGFDLPLVCAAVIGCDTILSTLPGGYIRNLTIMDPVMNMSQQLQTKALHLVKASYRCCLYTEKFAARVHLYSDEAICSISLIIHLFCLITNKYCTENILYCELIFIFSLTVMFLWRHCTLMKRKVISPKNIKTIFFPIDLTIPRHLLHGHPKLKLQETKNEYQNIRTAIGISFNKK